MSLAPCVDVLAEELFMFRSVSFRFKAKENLKRRWDVKYQRGKGPSAFALL